MVRILESESRRLFQGSPTQGRRSLQLASPGLTSPGFCSHPNTHPGSGSEGKGVFGDVCFCNAFSEKKQHKAELLR